MHGAALGSACNASRPTDVAGRRAGSDFALGRPALPGAAAAAAVVHVATTGSDGAGDGSQTKPFASLKRAQLAARAVQRGARSPRR